jgi:hydrogenase maturation protease
VDSNILVACIGNIFLGDDAFGVEVAKRLAERPLPEGVTVIDFGIRSYDLAYALMQEWDLVILVDALPRGGAPGTLYAFEPELPSEGEIPASLDAHTMNPVSVLQMVHALGGKVGHLLVVGCEPESVEPKDDGTMGLSARVAGALDEAVRMIHEVIIRARSQAMAA